MSTESLFTPFKIGKHELEHRVVLAPLTRLRADLDATPNDLLLEYYQQRASKGGLLITEATFIDRLAGAYRRAPGIYTKEHIESWKKITEAVHQKGGIIFLQLWHIGRAGSSIFNPNGELTVSSSDIPITGKNALAGGIDFEKPRPLTVLEIKEWVQTYKQAALNAIEAGFDGVEIHSANGYLLDQFINTRSNKRVDEYGGSIENRTRFPLEVVDAVVGAVGADRTAIRFSPGGAFQDMGDDSVIDTWGYLTSQLQQNHPDLAYVHFIETSSNILIGKSADKDTLAPFREIWKGPFIASNGYSNAIEDAAAYAKKNNTAIAFGRSFIANPDLPERIRNNWPLNPYDRPTFYTNEPKGYTDYPFYKN
ncbi:hypothetical protein G6F56_005900 [Rhizopus delemar]|uniref:NADH:flavin oxidoreductase/NADH oxidase N-terminal domain-containing protein n=1 Tax=Rhizopus stolonifer TaxID=4846 RepID=A0A367KMM3_RHIST|nr:hypothetical protein G6F56_005900 [Rhizopus delemar]RCI03485.1 hypothetical protein CU098_011887 [Rhizopus stolonifer]